MSGPATLLVIGIHREELAFGQQVAAGLEPGEVAVLRIGEGLSGRRPRADERFRYDTLHRELYHQLLSHVRKGGYRLVIDLHTGIDRDGPCADIYCRDAALRRCLGEAMGQAHPAWLPRTRMLPICPTSREPLKQPPSKVLPYAAGIMPDQVWNNPAFGYAVLEVFLPEHRSQEARDWDYGRGLVRLIAGCGS